MAGKGRPGPRFAAGVVALLSLFCQPGLAQKGWPPAPLPGYNIFDEQQEVWLGEVLAQQYGYEELVLHDPEATAYLQSLGEGLAETSKRPGLRYRFRVYESVQPDAFALPGGRIYVARAMLALCENEAELAAVLTHEIAHVALRQGPKTISRWLAWGPGIHEVGGKDDIRRAMGRLHTHLRETKFAQPRFDQLFGIMRGDELWADKYGIWNLNAAGYDPQAAIDFFRRYDAMHEREVAQLDPWRRFLYLLFAAHPAPRERANLLTLELPWMKRPANPMRDTEGFRALKRRLAAEMPRPQGSR